MCLIFIVKNQHPQFPMIIAGNRDEFYARPSLAAHYWPEQPDLLAGKDITAGGTWLGISKSGYFSAITNIREPQRIAATRSRGLLVLDALTHAYSAEQLQQIDAEQYAGFNLISGKLHPAAELYYRNSHTAQLQIINDGIHGLSNASLNTPWPKVTQGIAAIKNLLDKPFDKEEWFAILQNEEQAALENLPNTGVSREQEQLLSSRFIRSTHYGTRTSTIITVSQQHIHFYERNYHLSHTDNQHFETSS